MGLPRYLLAGLMHARAGDAQAAEKLYRESLRSCSYFADERCRILNVALNATHALFSSMQRTPIAAGCGRDAAHCRIGGCEEEQVRHEQSRSVACAPEPHGRGADALPRCSSAGTHCVLSALCVQQA